MVTIVSLTKKIKAAVKKLFEHVGRSRGQIYVNWSDVRHTAKSLPKNKQRKFFSKARKLMKKIKTLDKRRLKLMQKK